MSHLTSAAFAFDFSIIHFIIITSAACTNTFSIARIMVWLSNKVDYNHHINMHKNFKWACK